MMPEPDPRITEPYDKPFLTWYDGIFESVFIALHPFVRIEGIEPESAPRPVLVIDRAELPERLTLDSINKVSEQYKHQFSIDLPALQRMEKSRGVRVSWEEIRKACGFDTIAQVNRALLTTILALSEKYQNADDAEHLQAFCNANQIFLPTEDIVPPILEKSVCIFLKRIGCEELIVSDDFNHHIVSRLRTELDTENPWVLSDALGFRFNKIYPSDQSFLVLVPWDNFYTTICGRRSTLVAAKVEELFDGFWCDANTSSDWWRL